MLLDLWQTLTQSSAAETTGDGTGLVLLDDLVVLAFTGPDVRQFLQGYLTCDTAELEPGQLAPAALCNLQGRVIAFGWVCTGGADQLLWIVHSSLQTTLEKFMRPYLAFSRTTLALLAGDHLITGRLEAGQGNLGEGVNLELITAAADLRDRVEQCGCAPRNAFDRALVSARVPWLTAATSGQFLPQMLNLVALGAVSFDKGCYLGQEVVARAQHRGQVKRALVHLSYRGDLRLAPGTELRDAAERPAGIVIQCTEPSGNPAECLAVLREGAAPVHHNEMQLRSTS